MATEAPPADQGIGSLVKGIVSDVGDLIKKQFEFASAELRQDMRRTGEASRSLAVGGGVTLLGLVPLTLMLVHLLHWLTYPPGESDPGRLPLWACYGIVGVVILGIGVALLLVGKKQLDSFNPLPDKTLQSLKENLEWTTNKNSK